MSKNVVASIRPFLGTLGRLQRLGGRFHFKRWDLFGEVEAAGIEPGPLDDLGAVSPRHLAQVRDPPREMGGLRALLRVANRHPAVSVDQRDHGGPAQRSQPRSMVATSCSCSGPTAAHVAVALSGQPRWCGSVGPCAATQSVKRKSTASSGGASPGSGSDGQRGRRGTVAHLRDLPETWRVAGAGSAIASNASR